METLLALRNALKLGGSLLVTWGVALGVRLVLPRHLGPATFGVFQFADALTTTFFVLTSLGIETYIRKEVATRREHASDFFGGALLVRLVLGAAVLGIMAIVLFQTGRPAFVQRLVFVLGLAQLLLVLNGSYAAMLHAAGAVDGLAWINVGSKLLWGLGIVAGFALGGGVESVAVALFLSELAKTCVLAVLCRRHLGLELRVDFRHTKAMLIASLPFYLNYLAHAAYARLDVSMMPFLGASDLEIGWYGAASNLAGLAMLLSPLIGWVLLPMSSRAAARSDAELTTLMRRTIELILIVAIPVSLLLGIGADVLVLFVFGREFRPAIDSLRILAPMFVLTYTCMHSATMLIRLDRGWTVTAISFAGLAINPLLNGWWIPEGLARFGPGGGGIGAAAALIATELLVTGALLGLVAKHTFDARNATMLLKTAVVAALVVALDRVLARLDVSGMLRLGVDATVYGGLVVAWKAVRLREIVDFVRLAVHQGRGARHDAATI